MIVLGLAKQISIQKLLFIFIPSHYAAMKKLSNHRTGVFKNIFDVIFNLLN